MTVADSDALALAPADLLGLPEDLPGYSTLAQTLHSPSDIKTSDRKQPPFQLYRAPKPPHPPQANPTVAPSVLRYAPAAHAHLVLYLAALHGAAITRDGLSGTFAPPLHHEKLLAWWKVRLAASAVFLLVSEPSSSAAPERQTPQTPRIPQIPQTPQGADLAGVAMLHAHPAETSPHVAVVDLLLVTRRQADAHPQSAQLLLNHLAQHAATEGRSLLTAEAASDSAAAAMFATLGFVEAGRIPGFVVARPGASPESKRTQSVFYKDLAAS